MNIGSRNLFILMVPNRRHLRTSFSHGISLSSMNVLKKYIKLYNINYYERNSTIFLLIQFQENTTECRRKY